MARSELRTVINPGQRERAEVALGHLQKAASEMIAAAHAALDILDGAVSGVPVSEILGAIDHLGRRGPAVPDPGAEEGSVRPQPRGRVQRISVR